MPTTTIPGSYVCAIARTLRTRGIDDSVFLEGSSWTLERLTQPEARVEFPAFRGLLERAFTLTNELGLGVLVGREIGVGCHGILGFAVISAASLREAAQLVEQYIGTRSNLFEMVFSEDELGWLELRPTRPLAHLHEMLMVAAISGAATLIEQISTKPPRLILELAMPEPEFHRRLSLPNARWNAEHWRVGVAKRELELPLRLTDRSAKLLAVSMIERELAIVGRTGNHERAVRELLARSTQLPTLVEVATSLGISERTLKRALRARGTGFSNLVESVRKDRALQMLRTDELSVAQIAERLGYGSTGTFARAFRRWTGKSPKESR